ncbi:unnamed protein product, partial [Laminaria digitata]
LPRRQVTKAFVRLFKMRSQLDQLLFPEVMGKCFIINTPSIFSYVWAMFAPLVDARTRSKVGDYRRFYRCTAVQKHMPVSNFKSKVGG